LEIELIKPYIVPVIVLFLLIWRRVQKRKIKKYLKSLVRGSFSIVDVRTEREFLMAANSQSINIPLNALEQKLELLSKEKQLVFCCASGARSRLACATLRKNGFTNVFNAGSWRNTLL